MRKCATLPLKHFQAFKKRIPHLYSLITDARTHVQLGRYADNIILAGALASAVESDCIHLGSQAHGHYVKLGFSSDVFSCNNVIRMYSKLGHLDWGLKVFDEMRDRNVVSWTLIISSAVEIDDFELGMKAFAGMVTDGVRPNEFSFGSVMKLCGMHACDAAFGIHCVAVKIGLEENPFVCSSILNFYAKIGDVGSAEQIFVSSMNCLFAGCWNAMIAAYAHCSLGADALRVFSLMRRYGISMDEYSYVSGLKGCAVNGDLHAGKVIHGFIIHGELEHNTDVMNALVDTYFTFGENSSALKVFEKIRYRDVISWNSVFAGICQDENDAHELKKFFNAFMLSGLRPNRITFSVLFKQCARLQSHTLGLQFYCQSVQLGYSCEDSVASSFIDMLFSCGEIMMAQAIFDGVESRHTVVWNAMVRGHKSVGCNSKAMDIFRKSRQLGIEVDEYTLSTILEASRGLENYQMTKQIHSSLIKSGFITHGYVYSSLLKSFTRADMLASLSLILSDLKALDLPSWSTLMSLLVYHSCCKEVTEVFRCLLKCGMKPDEFILGSLLNNCANMAASHQTNIIHSLALKSGFYIHPVVGSALVDAYAKCGEIESAESIFSKSYVYGDNVLFNTMIMGYAHHGLVNRALDTFELMKQAKLQPSLPTFVSVISACSHLGYVNQGLAMFKSISKEYGLQPSHDIVGCTVDMLSRNGLLSEANYIIETMSFPPWPAIWRSLLNGCRIHGNIDLATRAAAELTRINPNDNAAYALLSKVYSEGSHWHDVTELKDQMATKSVCNRKEPGYSRIGI